MSTAFKWSDTLKKDMEDLMYEVFFTVGEMLKDEAQTKLSSSGHVASGDLYRSIGYATSVEVVQDSDEYPLPKPSSPLVMRFGTTCPYAKYVRYGVPGHGGSYPAKDQTKNVLEMFIEWGATKGFDERISYAIYKHVMNEGTRKDRVVDFLPPKSKVRALLVAEVKKRGIQDLIRKGTTGIKVKVNV